MQAPADAKMVLLGALAGLRVHEIARMHSADVDLVAGSLTGTGKGGSTQLIPLNEGLLEGTQRYALDGW